MMFYKKGRLKIEHELGSKPGIFQNAMGGDDPSPSGQKRAWLKKEAERLGKQLGKDIAASEVQHLNWEAIQNVAGLLVNEYYGKEKAFTGNKELVRELQENLVVIGYDLGTSGKNGVDGDLGAKTLTAIHNFEQDYVEQLKLTQKAVNEIHSLHGKGKGR